MWSLGAGLALSFFWIIRGEGVWLLPSIIILSIFSILKIRKNIRVLAKKLALILAPFFLLIFCITLISGINYHKYKIFAVTEFQRSEFLNAYGALTSIKDEQWNQYVPVSNHQLALAYKVSPAMKELMPFLEGDIGARWKEISSHYSSHPTKGEIDGGWFMWALRDAVAEAGYYKSGGETLKFYAKIAQEINGACDSGEVKCLGERSTMMPPLTTNYIAPFWRSFITGLKPLIKFDAPRLHDIENTGDASVIVMFDKFIRPDASTKMSNRFEGKILKTIRNFYNVLMPLVFSISIFLMLLMIRKSLKVDAVFIIYVLFIAIFSRYTILTLIDSTSFPAFSERYFSPLYSLIFLTSFLSVYSFASLKSSKN